MENERRKCLTESDAIKALEETIEALESKRGTGWDRGTFIDDTIASLRQSITNYRRMQN